MQKGGGGYAHFFKAKMGFLPKNAKKIGFNLDEMFHMGAHTFILHSSYIPKEDIYEIHMMCGHVAHTLYSNSNTPFSLHKIMVKF